VTFSAISDIHIKNNNDDRYDLLLRFMRHELVSNSDQIFLLGDIFDLALGTHKEYYELYKEFFNLLIKCSQQGKIIRFFEGNHDFHLGGFFEYLKCEKGLQNTQYYKVNYQERIDGKTFIFAHGDDIELDNPAYRRWKLFINNPFMKILMSDFLTFKFIQRLGSYLSNKSHVNNANKYQNEEAQNMIREKYRHSVDEFHKKRIFDYMIAGHSHVQEELITKDYSYYNCGYLPITKCFIYFDGLKVSSIKL
jgi:UDP-2,3-diacylglucosamine hydrolase